MLKALKKRLKDQRGLTLVELLAVVVILGIISAIAVPSIGGLIDKTRNDAKVAEALQIINAAKLSHTSNRKLESWKHTKETGDADTVGELSNMIENVKDQGGNYVVKYTEAGVYTIVSHDANSVANDADDDGELSEAELLSYTGN